ncbi:hypothetical protein JHK82_052304 [Glycine max]|uniref:Peptidase S9 prolyl oligopeptidase catalytic domain-containing protein n=2 Tax=Glycine subgen. Soja TaxID=1462606 RepID=K7MW78_SOYBN|nr:hypothetical protein JHK86_052136 [Glycine max]RZB46219.1 Acylamino-acid-releasing enzyme [Glycine soja]KAG4926505.1 hypothetical protein JHK85_052991 [Glycine max]KAG5082143.1 hypothetical protein JHK84_052181 [Glycine max]KAG5084907.1 hypothetical protein JHK82_052304 [Glycine max]
MFTLLVLLWYLYLHNRIPIVELHNLCVKLFLLLCLTVYARVLREKGIQVKVIVFPNDVHGIERPQSDFESYLNIVMWFNKYCK